MTIHDEGTDAPETRAADMARPAPAAASGTAQAEQVEDDNTLLFADEHRSGLHSRWNDVQAAFVDDPKECVQKADNLVAEVVEELTASFADTRSRLEAQWSRGEEASTEDLRVALTRYRDFFHRLLSV
ncbi:hypothetical protein H7J71_19620 [Mycolicibacterium peregrinum]|uniref:Uncharacterized protein n=1 Tax=Mycolicibacterium peregrinum TaxID=43304 RepID=A0A4Z0HNF1_MYCPR|nr:hypothetical protein [Mycolicibacterium peregrinum]MCV7204222.1 hypothetical protein [Mycolicibacterium peregrinum]TGB39328.1 hypothetical protein EJD98_22490 [Mycolicibacterium peregrinum]TGB39864.1 hypothetical protein EJD94_20995 [Mycolicibacterium peregrinum]